MLYSNFLILPLGEGAHIYLRDLPPKFQRYSTWINSSIGPPRASVKGTLHVANILTCIFRTRV